MACCGEKNCCAPGFVGTLDTPAGLVPRVSTELGWRDHLGTLRVRACILRTHYMVDPGLYAVGTPTPESPVLVSANYKLSFDCLRRSLGDLDAWILVIDTKGVNVWCAAGKGTFGTDELVQRIAETGLARLVSHGTLILPQLGAPGVAAFEVKKQSGFRVAYGPVRACDIPAYLAAGMQATDEMRRVRFNLADRLVVVPVELVQWGAHTAAVAAGLFLLAGLSREGYSWALAVERGPGAVLLLLAAYLAGGLVVPALLPWLPGRAFATKGTCLGVLVASGALLLGCIPSAGMGGKLESVAWLLLIPAAAAFMAMNFTGASTYTSLSGVRREMRIALPLQICAGVIGLGLWVVARFV